MKRIAPTPLLAGLALSLALTAHAQTNRTYSITPVTNTNTDHSGNSVAFLKNGKGHYVVSSIVKNRPMGTSDKLMLTKMDASGNPITAVLRDSTWGAERIIETSDTGILSVSDFPHLVKVTKYDQNLNQLWTQSYQKARPANLSEYSAVDIEPAVMDNVEQYFISFSEGSYDPVNYPSDEHPALIRIDHNGNLMWHHLYHNTNRNNYYPPNMVLRDKANSLVSFMDPNDPMRRLVAVAGTQILWDGGDLNPALFYMIVDEWGNILRQYKRVHSPSDAPTDLYYCPDIQFDGDSLVSSFTQQNTQIGPPPGIFSAYSILKTDVSLGGFRERAFWNSCENRSSTLSITGSGDNMSYVLSGMSGLCGMTSGMGPTLMAISPNSLFPATFSRYNVNSDVFASTGPVWSCFHRTDDSGYHYFPVDPHLNGYNTWISGFRVLVANPSLQTCGFNSGSVSTEDLAPTVNEIEYEMEQGLFTTFFFLPEVFVSVSYTDCDTATNPDNYRLAGEAVAAGNAYTAQVFPTLVNREDKITCNILSPGASTIEISITDALGRLINKEKHEIAAGSNTLQLETASFAHGLNLVHLRNEHFHSTTKVNVVR